ncbi:MAG: 5'-nucleotidase C-terminal domain-containing protein [Saprospiraceae bacterium]|nr:5'-nucleotidase C-terminal domain-containing protein [Saprospiraceae bacterium]
MNFKILYFTTFVFLFGSCAKKNYLADVTSRNYRIEKGSYTNDVAISDMIAPYKEKLDLTMNEVIGQNTTEMTKGKPNSTLTNWFADALYDEMNHMQGVKVDFAIQNYGGVRVNSFAAGNVTVGNVYELMPFDNTMFVLTMKGDKVQQLFDKIAESNGWPISKSVQFRVEFGKAADVTIHGKPLDPAKEYMAAIPDYVANGGDNMDFRRDCPKWESQKYVRDILINYIKRQTSMGLPLSADPSKRILLSGE